MKIQNYKWTLTILLLDSVRLEVMLCMLETVS